MTGEEMERAIAFILEQQAQFAANQQRYGEALLSHEETMRDHEENMRDHEEIMRDHEEIMRGHKEIMRGHDEIMRGHEETMRGHEETMRGHEETMRRVEAAQERTALQVQHLSGAMIELADAHTRTENTLAATNEKLNALITTVERHIGEGRNGKA